MVAVKRKLSEKRIFDSLKSENSDDDPIIKSDENANNDEGDETASEHEEESEDDTSENLDNTNQEFEKSQDSSNEECGNVEEEQNNSCKCQGSDSESEVENLETSKSVDRSETDDECVADCSQSKNILHN